MSASLSTSESEYLTAKQLCELLGIQQITAAKWRRTGKGPNWIRLPGVRTIRYARTDIDAWLKAGTVGKPVQS